MEEHVRMSAAHTWDSPAEIQIHFAILLSFLLLLTGREHGVWSYRSCLGLPEYLQVEITYQQNWSGDSKSLSSQECCVHKASPGLDVSRFRRMRNKQISILYRPLLFPISVDEFSAK